MPGDRGRDRQGGHAQHLAVRHLIKPTKRTRLARRRDRGTYERETINAILDEAFICHVGFQLDGQPYVVPTVHARIGERLYIHGSVASRMLKSLSQGINVCVTVTLLDGLVLARSAFHHSMNYRSVLVLGTATAVTDKAEKRERAHGDRQPRDAGPGGAGARTERQGTQRHHGPRPAHR